MSGKNIIDSIKGRNSDTEKLRKVNKKINDLKSSNTSKIGDVLKKTLSKAKHVKGSKIGRVIGKTINKTEEKLDNLRSPKISEIEKIFGEKLFGVLNSSPHIHVDSDLFDVIKEIGNNLEEIKKDSVLKERVKNIEFDTDTININNMSIINTQELPHNNYEEAHNSISALKKSDGDLTDLEDNIIPRLEKRFDNNIEILENISNEQNIFTRHPRQLDDINNELDLRRSIQISGGASDDVDKKIEELKHEKSLRENIDKLETTSIGIPDGFLPFGSDDTIAKEGAGPETTEKYIFDFEERREQLGEFKKEIENIRNRYQKNMEKLEKISKLQDFHKKIKSRDNKREEEVNSIIDICKSLSLGEATYNPRVQDYITRVGGNSGEIALNFVNGPINPDKSIEYSLCDKEGCPFSIDKDNYRIITGNNPKISLRGISFDNEKQTMKIDNFEIDPIESITFPLKLNLNINVSIEDKKTGLTIDHHKPILIEIARPKLTEQERKNAYSGFEDVINKKIEYKYEGKGIKDIENETIRNILYEGGKKSEINKIWKDPHKREYFIKKIRDRLAGYLPSLTEDKLKIGFKKYMVKMVKEDRHVPFKYLLNEEKFKEYINDNWETCLKDYTNSQIYENISKYRDDILSCFFGPQNLSNRTKKDSENNNYTKFLVGESRELKNRESKINDKKIIKYSMKTEVKGANTITTNIEIDGKKPEEIIEAKNHDELIEKILNLSKTKNGDDLPEKLRCDIALSVLKSMIDMCPKMISRKIPNQNYSDGTKEIISNRIKVVSDTGGNLKLRACKISSKSIDPSKEEGKLIDSIDIFDEVNYKDKYDNNSINELKKGIRKISTEINIAMNTLAKDYQETIHGKNRSLLEYNTDGHFKGEDVKKLWWKLRYGETNNNFDFNTEIKDLAGKKIKILFNQGKFSFSGEFEGQEYKYEAYNLGDILKKKSKDGKRIFDGLELKIINVINEKYVGQLRSNKIIKNNNFIVSDFGENRTGRYYIFDSKGVLSYFEVGNQGTKRFGNVDAGSIKLEYMPKNRIICDEAEKKEFFQNPMLAGKLIREMKKSLTLFHSKEVSERKTKWRNKRKSFKKMTIGNKAKFIGSAFEKSASNLINKKNNKNAPRYSYDRKKIDEIIIKAKTDDNLKTVFYNNTDETYLRYKMSWNLEATTDYLNKKISSKKYLKALGLSLDGASDEEIKAEANRRAEVYKPYLDDNNKS